MRTLRSEAWGWVIYDISHVQPLMGETVLTTSTCDAMLTHSASLSQETVAQYDQQESQHSVKSIARIDDVATVTGTL